MSCFKAHDASTRPPGCNDTSQKRKHQPALLQCSNAPMLQCSVLYTPYSVHTDYSVHIVRNNIVIGTRGAAPQIAGVSLILLFSGTTERKARLFLSYWKCWCVGVATGNVRIFLFAFCILSCILFGHLYEVRSTNYMVAHPPGRLI